MSEPLRPLTLGEILDRTIQIYRSRFLVFLGIAAMPAGVILVFFAAAVLLITWAGSGGQATSNPALVGIVAVLAFTALLLIVLPVLLAVMAMGTAATNHAAVNTIEGASITIRASFAAAWKRGWRYLWLYLLQALITWGVPVVVWVVLVLLAAGGAALGAKSGLGAGSAFLLFIPFLGIAVMLGYIFWMTLMLSLAFPTCVVEQKAAWPALKRAITLSKGTRGRIFVLYLLNGALNYLMSLLITIPAVILIALLPNASNPQHAQTAGMVILYAVYGAAFAAQMLTKPIVSIALVLFYYDQRIRNEGYDIERMMQQAGLVAPEPSAEQTVPAAAPWLPVIQQQTIIPQPETEPLQPGEIE